jgi:hypothetical protein
LFDTLAGGADGGRKDTRGQSEPAQPLLAALRPSMRSTAGSGGNGGDAGADGTPGTPGTRIP